MVRLVYMYAYIRICIMCMYMYVCVWSACVCVCVYVCACFNEWGRKNDGDRTVTVVDGNNKRKKEITKKQRTCFAIRRSCVDVRNAILLYCVSAHVHLVESKWWDLMRMFLRRFTGLANTTLNSHFPFPSLGILLSAVSSTQHNELVVSNTEMESFNWFWFAGYIGQLHIICWLQWVLLLFVHRSQSNDWA